MPQPEKTVAQEIIEDGTEKAPEMITVGDDEGKKPTLEGESGETKQQEFENELFEAGDSKETPPEGKAAAEPKELEKAKADAAFWQTAYQDFDAKVKQADPSLRDNLNKQLRAQRKGKEQETTNGDVQKSESVTTEKLDIYENPQGVMNAIVAAVDSKLEKFGENISSKFQQNQDLAYQQASWEQEAKAAEQAVNRLKSDYRAELKLDDNAWKGVEDNAWRDVADIFGLTDENRDDFIGTLGNPSKAAKVFQKSLENRLLKHSYLTKVAEGRADVSGKIKAMAEVAQPTSQATPSPKTISKKEKIIQSIEGATGAKDAKSELFG